jgi:hypothetical protein
MVLMEQICFQRFFTQKKGFCMKLKFAFARKVAVGLMAVAVAAAGANAFAANYTWKNGQTNLSRVWATASNWNPGVTPANGDSVFFGPGSTGATAFQVNVGNTDTNAMASATFTSAASAGYRVISSGGSLVLNGALVNNSTALNSQGTGKSSVLITNLKLDGDSTLSGSGAPTEVFSSIFGVGKKLTVTGNNLILDGATSEAKIEASTGSTVSLSQSVTLADFTVGPAGTVGGEPTRPAGEFFGTLGDGVIEFQNASTVNMGVLSEVSPGSTYDQFSTTGAITFGGSLNIDWAQVGSSTFANYTSFDLFDGGSYAGNFSAVSLAGGVAPYDTLSFTQFGTEWSTQPFIGQGGQQQWLVFQAQTGNLVVVPEPSTIVFAGLGVAMSGWTMWKKRRLSKLLAAKVA